ncbi:hypothetical protein HDV01_000879 [Terramyces sp. JEL0728]|nr:hypothetical protein HDV01_000879 [Terramyces sp. JEL0728]
MIPNSSLLQDHLTASQTEDIQRLNPIHSDSNITIAVPGVEVSPVPLASTSDNRITVENDMFDSNSTGLNIYNSGYSLPFKEFLQHYPYAEARKAVAEGSAQKIGSYRSLLLEYMFSYLQKPPIMKPSTTCTRPILPVPQCETNYPNVFSGNRSTPAKVGIAIQFGLEIDTLWIALEQYYGLVDKVFLLESNRAHKAHTKKPIIWDRIKNTPRFFKFNHMVVHMLVDDIPRAVDDGNIWQLEDYQERIRWDKFVEWNNQMKYFGDDDIIGFGDADEVPSLESLNHLKHCQLKPDVQSVDVGIWFPMGTLNDAFRPDFPVDGEHGFTLGDPTFYTLKSAIEYATQGGVPNRRRGGSGHSLVGGMHMSNYVYLPVWYSKLITCTECPGFEYVLDKFEKVIDSESIKLVEEDEYFKSWDGWRGRMTTVDKLDASNKEAVKIPWFLECNLDLFPAWRHLHDTRLD